MYRELYLLHLFDKTSWQWTSAVAPARPEMEDKSKKSTLIFQVTKLAFHAHSRPILLFHLKYGLNIQLNYCCMLLKFIIGKPEE
jgi:hypothetical protein